MSNFDEHSTAGQATKHFSKTRGARWLFSGRILEVETTPPGETAIRKSQDTHRYARRVSRVGGMTRKENALGIASFPYFLAADYLTTET